MEKVFREIKSKISFERRTNLDFPAHIHEDIELVFVKQGRSEAYSNGKKYDLTANTVFLVFPNQVHHYSLCEHGEYIVLIMKAADLLCYNDVFSDGIPDCSVCEINNEQAKIILFLLETALSEYEKDGHDTVIDAYLTAAIGKLLKYYKIDRVKATRNKTLQILAYCSQHHKEPISIDDVANALHISKSTVSDTFSKELSIGFCDYINSLRLTNATKLLIESDHTIAEIASLSGFPTIRTFNRVFSVKYCISPSQYRNDYLQSFRQN